MQAINGIKGLEFGSVSAGKNLFIGRGKDIIKPGFPVIVPQPQVAGKNVETTGSVASKGVETTGSIADARKKPVEPLFNFGTPETTGSVANSSFSLVA